MYWTEFKKQQKVVEGLIKMRTESEDGEQRRLAMMSQELRRLINIAEDLYKEIERRQNP